MLHRKPLSHLSLCLSLTNQLGRMVENGNGFHQYYFYLIIFASPSKVHISAASVLRL